MTTTETRILTAETKTIQIGEDLSEACFLAFVTCQDSKATWGMVHREERDGAKYHKVMLGSGTSTRAALEELLGELDVSPNPTFVLPFSPPDE